MTSFCVFSQDTIVTTVAKQHINKLVCVTGKVVSIKKASENQKTNYLNLDVAYPNNIFTVVMTNDFLETNQLVLEDFKNKTVFVYGKITVYKNDEKQTPQIFNPRRIDIKK